MGEKGEERGWEVCDCEWGLFVFSCAKSKKEAGTREKQARLALSAYNGRTDRPLAHFKPYPSGTHKGTYLYVCYHRGPSPVLLLHGASCGVCQPCRCQHPMILRYFANWRNTPGMETPSSRFVQAVPLFYQTFQEQPRQHLFSKTVTSRVWLHWPPLIDLH